MGKVIDKNYCMSSFLTLRYVADPNKIWKDGVVPRYPSVCPDDGRVACATPEDIDRQIKNVLGGVDLSHAAILLSGGIDSGILAAYMPKGAKAYTAHNQNSLTDLEVQRAKTICEINHLEHVVVEIGWQDYENCLDDMMLCSGCPASANEAQISTLVKRAKEDGNDLIIYGDEADLVFGGMDQLLSKDWTFEEWIERYSYVKPERALRNPVDMTYIFLPYKTENGGVDTNRFLRHFFAISSGISYTNSFYYHKIKAVDPYSTMIMKDPLDITRVRSGDSKYLLRALYRKLYPTLELPEKIAIQRAMDTWLKDWEGPRREEFIPGCMDGLTYEKRYQLYILERFLNLIDG